MGNHALRREAAKTLKAVGVRLYTPRSGENPLYRLTAKRLRQLIELARFRVGDLAQNCDGFNHRLIKLGWDSYFNGHVYTGDFEFEDGPCCGCGYAPESPWSVEAIEKYWYAVYYTERQRPQWFLGENGSPIHKARDEALLRGKSITDEEGKLLPQFR